MIDHPVVRASFEVSSAGAILTWWANVMPTLLGIIATLLSISWYVYCFYDAGKKTKKRKRK